MKGHESSVTRRNENETVGKGVEWVTFRQGRTDQDLEMDAHGSLRPRGAHGSDLGE